MLVNMADGEVQLIEIETAEITRRFLGQKQREYVIRSSFGGADENLIISGSEGKALALQPSRIPSLRLSPKRRTVRNHRANTRTQMPKSIYGTKKTAIS